MAMDPNNNNQPPLPGNHTILRGDSRKHVDEMKRVLEFVKDWQWFQEVFRCNNLPPRVLPYPNMQPPYVLQFFKEVRNPTFTSDLVRDKIGDPMKVAIYDMSTQSIISRDNSLSFAKVKIAVLDAELWKNIVTWSTGEFNQSVLSERERKGPLLTGRSLIIQLENGVGTFQDIVFNDNSSWTKSGFRLGVMVVNDREEGAFNGERVLEGVSEPFRVKDRRGKATQKPDRLELTHCVRFIKKIGKDRTSLLQMKGINTVDNFLWWYYNKESELRETLGIKSESSKEWESMIEHVLPCAGEYHAKRNASNNSSQPWQVSVHPMERNMPLSTNGGRLVVGLGPSAPNLSENNRIEGDMLAINRQHDPSNVFSCLNDFLLSEPFPSDGDGSSQIDPLGYFAFDERLSLSKTTG
ncbi:calmodulin-binding protein 60 A-like isoform X2 [Carex rostrata]